MHILYLYTFFYMHKRIVTLKRARELDRQTDRQSETEWETNPPCVKASPLDHVAAAICSSGAEQQLSISSGNSALWPVGGSRRQEETVAGAGGSVQRAKSAQCAKITEAPSNTPFTHTLSNCNKTQNKVFDIQNNNKNRNTTFLLLNI